VIVGIDSLVVIYAGLVPKKAVIAANGSDPGSEDEKLKELQRRAEILISDLADKQATVILSTLALSEILVPVPSHQKGVLIAQLSKRFAIAPFSIKAAALAADLWAQSRGLPKDQQYGSRQLIKTDAMIIAASHAVGATDFFTCDPQCRKMAKLIMRGHDLPTNSEDLFYGMK
jgi:hypothetical protein